MITFYRWLVLFSLIVFGVLVCFYTGVVEEINRGDFTKISFIIFLIFFSLSVYIGRLSYIIDKVTNIKKKYIDDIIDKSEIGWFFSHLFLTMGMTGTVFGFIYMLQMNLIDFQPGNVASLREPLSQMTGGVSAALYTTASGLVSSVLLQLQLFNLKMKINKLERWCDRVCDCETESE